MAHETEFTRWFARSNGSWKSSRRYLYGPKRKADNYETEFSVNTVDNTVTISWDGDKSSGDMNFVLEGNLAKRDVGYFTDEPTNSEMTMIDKDCVVFVTSYDGTTYREEIRLCYNDNVRLRQTVAQKDNGDINIVGQYFEERVNTSE